MEDHKVVRNHPKICEPFSNSENLLNVNETGFKLLLDFTLISSELPESGSKQSSLGYKNFKHPKEKPFLPSGFSSHLNIKDPELEQFIIHTIVKTKGHDTAEVRAVNILLKGKKAFANSKDMLLWIKLLKKFIK